ncbi:MAG TPA: hypothetical protein VFF16_19620 [Telluria sp.]|nr:hypothetical protein [Telluria sp.]
MELTTCCEACGGKLEYKAPMNRIVMPWLLSDLANVAVMILASLAFAALGMSATMIGWAGTVAGAIAAGIVFLSLAKWVEKRRGGMLHCRSCARSTPLR